MAHDISLKHILEAALFSADEPLNIADLQQLFSENEQPEKTEIQAALAELQTEYQQKAIELVSVKSGYRFQTSQVVSQWVGRLYEEKPQRYSRALLETLAIIVYRQPITRTDIEDIRGVSVSSSIVRTLMDRDWVKIVGHKEVPGRPALLATTKQFLDYFNLTSLEQLPPLADVRDLDEVERSLQKLDQSFTADTNDAAECDFADEAPSERSVVQDKLDNHELSEEDGGAINEVLESKNKETDEINEDSGQVSDGLDLSSTKVTSLESILQKHFQSKQSSITEDENTLSDELPTTQFSDSIEKAK